MSHPPVAAIILAAGRSRRMGRPKMLLPWGEATVLGRVVGVYAQTGLQEIVVVTGAEHDKIEQSLGDLAKRYTVRAVYNPAYLEGEMLSSLQAGLAALGPELEAALIGLGDQPQMEAATVHSILTGYETLRARIIVPSYRMRRGHPWLVRRELWDEIRGMKASQTPRDFLNTHSREIKYVDVDTASILEDLDTPEDYERALHD